MAQWYCTSLESSVFRDSQVRFLVWAFKITILVFILKSKMREVGFEPTKALSHRILSPAPLTTREPPHKNSKFLMFKKITDLIKLIINKNMMA